MAPPDHEAAMRKWTDIASAFLRLGTTAYGGPAIMGLMQVELQQKRQWLYAPTPSVGFQRAPARAVIGGLGMRRDTR
jgi:hypothetical protein